MTFWGQEQRYVEQHNASFSSHTIRHYALFIAFYTCSIWIRIGNTRRDFYLACDMFSRDSPELQIWLIYAAMSLSEKRDRNISVQAISNGHMQISLTSQSFVLGMVECMKKNSALLSIEVSLKFPSCLRSAGHKTLTNWSAYNARELWALCQNWKLGFIKNSHLIGGTWLAWVLCPLLIVNCLPLKMAIGYITNQPMCLRVWRSSERMSGSVDVSSFSNPFWILPPPLNVPKRA